MSKATIRLGEIQKTLKAPKGQRNSFGNYNYRSLEDIMEAVKPLLKEDESVILADEIVMVGDRYYVKATATFNQGAESISASAFAREPFDKKGMDSAQITGATSSYARKYACNGLFAIDDTKDADTADNTSEKVKGRNTGVRIPAGYWKAREHDPQGAQELLGGEGYFPGKTETGYFIFTTKTEKEDADFVSGLGKAPEPPKNAPESPRSDENEEKAISLAQQLEIVALVKKKGIHHLTAKKHLKDEFGYDGTAQIKLKDFIRVYEFFDSRKKSSGE